MLKAATVSSSLLQHPVDWPIAAGRHSRLSLCQVLPGHHCNLPVQHQLTEMDYRGKGMQQHADDVDVMMMLT